MGVGGRILGFNSRAGQIGHCRQRLASAATFLCYPGAIAAKMLLNNRNRWKQIFHVDTHSAVSGGSD